jgi:hypothetical protein
MPKSAVEQADSTIVLSTDSRSWRLISGRPVEDPVEDSALDPFDSARWFHGLLSATKVTGLPAIGGGSGCRSSDGE